LPRLSQHGLERGGTNEHGRFRINQLLVKHFGHRPDPVGDIGTFQLPKELKENRLVKSHHALCLSVREF